MSRGDLFLILGNQLFAPKHLDRFRDAAFVMVEDAALCTRLPFHQQKLAFLLGAMREHRTDLIARGFELSYFDLDAKRSLADAIEIETRRRSARRLLMFETEDRYITRTVRDCAESLGLSVHTLPSPMFLTSLSELDAFFDGRRAPRMADFYKQQRRRLDLLLENGRPLGGRWSHDVENRRRVPADLRLPEVPRLRRSATIRRVVDTVRTRFAEHPGDAGGLWLPTNRSSARRWLGAFLEERLQGFGSFEDAITERSATVHHSVLSPLLNVGLVTPAEVVRKTVSKAAATSVPINDLEGFVRQVVGWREFVRGVYRFRGQSMHQANVWGASRGLTAGWHEASTGLAPLDHALRGALDRAWNHHIERLMVIANLMNLCEIHPRVAHRFFMTYYVDAYDWVMQPNVFGMGLMSDGGVFATKPYICGSSYLLKMSDHAKGEWCDVVDGLYWRFVSKHRHRLAANARSALMVRGLDRLNPERAARIRVAAETFLAERTTKQP